MNTKFEKALRGAHETQVISYDNIDNEKGGYIQMILSTPARKEYKVNIFPSNLNYWANNLARVAQSDSDDLEDILNKLINDRTKFTLFYGLVNFSADGRRFTNGISFSAPTAAAEDNEVIGIF